ncbi:hypothetical protein EMCRGX_G016979 [Ephydatia muelleri]
MSDEGPIEESILHAALRLGYHDLREQQLHAAKKFLQVTTRKKIHCILGMKDPVIIAMSPDKANMSYWVKERGIVEETFAPLAAKLSDICMAYNMSKFRLVDIDTSVTQKEIQESIVKSFSCATASLRIVVCTIAFGMGIDCAGVNQVIHWRPSADVVELGEMVRHLVQ